MGNFFEKLGLVEKVEKPINVPEYDTENIPEEDEVDVNTENVSTDNFVNDVYASNNLLDVDSSIFKVEEIVNNLPDTMPTVTKKTSVLGILLSFGLTVEDLIDDADTRKDYIHAAVHKINEDMSYAIEDAKNTIENAKVIIQEAEAKIAECEKNIKNTSESAVAETSRIEKLVEFIKEEEKND